MTRQRPLATKSLSALRFVRVLGAACAAAVAVATLPCLSSGLSAQRTNLGPADGHDLPATDLERVSAGTEAPLFALDSYGGETVELAQFRGRKNVVLVFYRGHW